MAFVKNNIQQISLFDTTLNLTPREKRMLQKSWAQYFREHVFPNINEERFSVLYGSNHASKPNNPVNVTLGLLLLKSMFHQNDEEVFESLLFDS